MTIVGFWVTMPVQDLARFLEAAWQTLVMAAVRSVCCQPDEPLADCHAHCSNSLTARLELLAKLSGGSTRGIARGRQDHYHQRWEQLSIATTSRREVVHAKGDKPAALCLSTYKARAHPALFHFRTEQCKPVEMASCISPVACLYNSECSNTPQNS